MLAEPPAEPRSLPLGPLARRLTHPSLLTRFTTLLAVAVTVFVFCWSLAYMLLPQGVLRGRTGGAALAGGDQAASSFTLEWLRIFAVNFVIVAGAVVASNLLRTRRGVPLGYWSALVMIGIAAVVTGTNSFSIQAETTNKLAPSLELLGHPGPYELASYVLATTAAFGVGRWQLTGRWPHSKAHRLPPAHVNGRQLGLGLAAAGLTLLITAAWEAARIVANG